LVEILLEDGARIAAQPGIVWLGGPIRVSVESSGHRLSEPGEIAPVLRTLAGMMGA
jgi:uncharacterized protein (DUF2345 family)